MCNVMGSTTPKESLKSLHNSQLSGDVGYVMYSAFGSFYIPSCIMVFVYIKIYFAARFSYSSYTSYVHHI